ncbi:PIN domain-containing protein [Lysobacter olei]
MSKPYFLIDFENVQPKALDRLKPGESRIKVFLGQHQNKLMLELVQALQPFGADAQYIQITGSGPDAVDFHIAYYIGRLAADEPGATFNIISKDRGFDPLVRHLAGLGITCRRLPEIPGGATAATPAKKATAAAKPPAKAAAKTAAKAPAKKAAKKLTVTVLPEANGAPPSAATSGQRVQEVVARLKKSSKPAKLATLKSSIKSWFKPPMDDKAVAAIVQSLQDRKLITVTGAKVTYTLG